MISENIKSLRETIKKDYTKPDPKRLEKYQEDLQNNEEAMGYLHFRGLTTETIEHFRLGYSEEWHAIAIPVFKNKELVQIKYRNLDPEKENKYFGEKGAEPWLFNEDGLEIANQKKAILIVEGEFDCMMAWQNGITNVVSPSAGKDSHGLWLELLEEIPRIYVAYDNDAPGKEASRKLSDRVGVDRSFEVTYPEGIKDANEYFKEHTKEEFLELVKKASPFHRYQFKGLGDIIETLREKKDVMIETEFIPNVKIEKDWLMVISGRSNIGKTSFVLNVADDLASQGIPTLIMPFERGVESVGKRFLQVKFEKTYEDFTFLNDEEWDDLIEDCIHTPIYFSVPNKDQIIDTIVKSRRLFDTRFVIIDHLDYVVRGSNSNREAQIGSTLQELKRVAEDYGVVICIVTHVRKIDSAGGGDNHKPGIEDLKGSSSLYQDPECVVMLHGSGEGTMDVNVVKNKGAMDSRIFGFDPLVGKLTESGDDF